MDGRQDPGEANLFKIQFGAQTGERCRYHGCSGKGLGKGGLVTRGILVNRGVYK